MLVTQFHIPVGKIDEVSPAFVLRRGKRHVDKWAPFGPFRSSNQTHVRFLRKSVAFARVTPDARANDIFPSCRSASIARHDVIEIQFVALKNLTAVLTGVLVALEHIVSRKLHFLFRKPIEKEQHDHARHADLPRDGGDHFVFRRGHGKIPPALEIVCHEIVRLIGRNHVGVSCIHERECAARSADVHRLPQTVQDQNLTV
jgi:hypothetical protein